MKRVVGMGQAREMNPYVIQATKLSESLSYLSSIFNSNEVSEKNYSDIDVDRILNELWESENIERYSSKEKIRGLIVDILNDIELYGHDMSVKNKRKLMGEFREFDTVYEVVKREFVKIKKRVIEDGEATEGREACFSAISTYAGATREATKMLEKSIFEDKRIEKRIVTSLKKYGVKVLKTTVLMSEKGSYEIILTAKSKKGTCITTKEVVELLSEVIGRRLRPEANERMSLSKEYTSIHFTECPQYQLIHGVSQRIKSGSSQSGDNFLVMDIGSGKKGIILSDGMGSGEGAYKMSGRILDAMEALLGSGLSLKNTMSICNSMLVSSQKGMDFGTLDVCIMDTCNGEIEIGKAGASHTFIVGAGGSKMIEPSSLPIGIVNGVDVDYFQESMEDGTFVVMMTDGVSELMNHEDKANVVGEMIHNQGTNNPKELAESILSEILARNNEQVSDDMMVLVVGCWKIGM